MKRKTHIIILVIGVLLLIIGLFFKNMNWPDMFFGIYSGTIIILIDIILLLKNRNDEPLNP